MFVASVMRNSTRPAAMSPDTVKSSPPARPAMNPEIVAPPFSRIWMDTSGTCGSNRNTAMVSPSARPSPSIEPPMIPPRPNGSTTVRTMPHRVPPRASAASFSAGGVWAKTSRETEAMIGRTMSDTTIPAMNIEPLKLAFSSVAKKGIQPKWSARNCDNGMMYSPR